MGADSGASFYGQAEAPFALAALNDSPAREFAESMPERYRRVFDAAAASEHAAIVARRGGEAIHIEAWRELPDGGVCLCVVARDGPGLLALLSASFIAREIDVVAAHAFCRALSDGSTEAVDFFWLRRAPGVERQEPLAADEVGELASQLAAQWGPRADGEAMALAANLPRPRMAPTMRTHVSFSDSPDDGGFVLTVQTHDRPGLLLAITRTLFESGLRISRSEVRTRSGVVCDRFHLLEQDGSAVPEDTRRRVQADVHASVTSLATEEPSSRAKR
ncbi:MAG TPA: hypothetical protein VKU41_08910 [Polyangiaceae bacterium]|nr:hypothetical protein [Polyangiaceae bacterium]